MSNESNGGLTNEYPVQFQYVGSYDDTVASWVTAFNNNASMDYLLSTSLGSSGIMNDGAGTINGVSSSVYPDPESLNPTNVELDGWKVYFKSLGYIKRYEKFIVNLNPESGVGAVSNGVRHLYLTAVKTETTEDTANVTFSYKITLNKLTAVDTESVHLLRYELHDNKITNLIVLPDIAGTAPLTRTDFLNKVPSVLGCVVEPIKGSTAINLISAQLLLEGGNCYHKDNNDPNIITMSNIERIPIYYCDADDYLSTNGRPDPVENIDTTKYKDVVDGKNVIKDLPDDRFAIQQLCLSPDGTLVAQYGLGNYSSLQQAVDAIKTESFNWVNMDRSDIFSPIFRVAYKSNTLNSADDTRFSLVMVQLDGQVTAGGSAGGVFQSQLAQITNRVDILEYRNNMIVTTTEGLPSITNIRVNDIVFEVKESY